MAEIKQSVTGSLNTFGGVPIDGFGKTILKPQINPDALYAVNWNSLTNVNDLVTILASIGFVFGSQHAHFDQIKHLLDLENPIIPQPQPNQDFLKSEINLPKL